MSLLEVDDVTKNFGRLAAVDGVTLRVEPGELRAIIGPNGAGKTTFFNLVSGFFPPSSGAIRFGGRDVGALGPAARVKLGLARTFQITEVFPDLDVAENLRVAAESAAGLAFSFGRGAARRAGIDGEVDRLLSMAGLADRRTRQVGELSHGDQRAVEIAMALALKPKLLMLDEPTAGMGDQETHDVARLIRRLHRDAGLAIVLIEHDMRVVFNLAQRIMVLAEGRTLAEGTPAEIAKDERVQAAYLGEAA